MSIKQIIILVVCVIILLLLYYFYEIRPKKNIAVDTRPNLQPYFNALENTPLYCNDIAGAIVDCVKANHQNCELICPIGSVNHHAKCGTGVGVNTNGQIIFRYKFKRIKTSPGGGKLQYSTLPVGKMVESLNESFGSYCRTYGLLPRQIVSKEEADNGQVYFHIVAFDSLQEAINYLHNIGVMI